MKIIVHWLNEHRVQLAIGFLIALGASGLMTFYENDFEHRYDDVWADMVHEELSRLDDTYQELKNEYEQKRIIEKDYRELENSYQKKRRELASALGRVRARPFGWEWLENLELKMYDSRFIQRGVRKPSGQIVIIAYDDLTDDQLKILPWPRDFHAHVVEKLKAAGAKVICFDTRFDAYRGYKPGDFIHFANVVQPSPGDLKLAEEAKKAGNVIVTADFLEETGQWRETLRLQQQQTRYLSYPYPDANGDAWELGYGISRKPKDSDTFVRRSYLVFDVKPSEGSTINEKYASLAALTAGAYAGIDEETLCSQLAKGRFGDKRLPLIKSMKDPSRIWQADTCLMNYYGPRGTFTTRSYFEVLSDDDDLLGGNPDLMKQLFNNKIVFIGPTAELYHDSHSAPFASKEQPIPGVEIHATMAEMLLSGNFVYTAARSTNVAAILLTSIITVLLVVLMSKPVATVATRIDKRFQFTVRGMKVRLYGPVWFLLYGLTGIIPPAAIYYLFALYLFIAKNLWITIVYPVTAAFLTEIGVVATMFLTEEVKRRKAIGRFEQLVAPSVLQEILKHPGEAEELPKPKRVEATLIFTDLQGFTTLSEQNSPEVVVEVLNQYLTRMNSIIFKWEGTIDKYEGDAIMIAFGVPYAQSDHARRAVLCCVEMQEECAKFRIEVCRPNGWPDVYMRVGISSGEVVAGLIGGGDRYDYTTIGDTVNLAARLEPLNKQTRSWILCSAQTYEQVKDAVIADYVPGIQVKGKTQSVDVYAIHGTRESGRRDHLWGEGADRAPKAPTESVVGVQGAPFAGEERAEEAAEPEAVAVG